MPFSFGTHKKHTENYTAFKLCEIPVGISHNESMLLLLLTDNDKKKYRNCCQFSLTQN